MKALKFLVGFILATAMSPLFSPNTYSANSAKMGVIGYVAKGLMAPTIIFPIFQTMGEQAYADIDNGLPDPHLNIRGALLGFGQTLSFYAPFIFWPRKKREETSVPADLPADP